jgi:hypothetical protein
VADDVRLENESGRESTAGSNPAPSANNLVERLRKRAEIRRQISTRKSVQEGKPDRIAELLDEAAERIEELETENKGLWGDALYPRY